MTLKTHKDWIYSNLQLLFAVGLVLIINTKITDLKLEGN